ncbi:TPA: hypothetical protein L5675_002534 [Pseudomonas aeruginosa]|nr:hypothetical protein [Pseudomonas aeruginosa]
MICGRLDRSFQGVPALFEKRQWDIYRISSSFVGMLVDMLPAEGSDEVLLRREA